MSQDKLLSQANSRLKSGAIGLHIEIKKKHLVLRGQLPPKPDSDRTSPYEQRIYLSYPPTVEGIKQAEKDAASVRAALIEKRFDWFDWSKTLQKQAITPLVSNLVGDVIARFEADYFTKRVKNPKSLTTWQTDYLPVFKKLPQDKELNEAVILAAIATTTPETRTRKRYVMALSAIAKFVGLNIDISSYGRGYTPAKLEVRDLPSDAEIVQHWELIPNKAWQNAYALMACYGIRPHEIMHLDLSILPNLHVLSETKTGERIVKVLPPEWFELFDINAAMELPQIKGRTNREIGDRVVTQFSRYGIPYPPYNLRHCFAVRCSISYQIPVAIAARMLGHSAAVHEATYLRHIRQDQVDSVYAKAIATKDNLDQARYYKA